MEAIRWQEVALRHRFHALRELALQVLLEREEPCGREFWQDYLRDYPATAVSGMFQVGTDEGLDALQQVYKHNGLGTAKDILEAKLPWIASRDLNFKQKFDRARDRFPEELRQVVDEWYGLPPLAGKPRVLLVVEDEKPIIEDISLFYEKFHDGGWRVEGLHVPKGGILPEVVVRQAAQCQADVVVLDMRFGDDEWAGMKLIPPLCQDNRFRPVIVNTVHTDAERLTECWNLGAADFTTKHLTTPDPEHGGLPLWISHLAMRVDLATRNSIVSRDLDKRLGEVENQAVTVRSRMLSLGRNGALRRSEESLRGYVNLGFEDRQSGVDSDVSEEVH
jgi:CheY-like chemotaxis protein